MKRFNWLLGTLLLSVLVMGILFRPFPFLFFPDLPYESLIGRAMFILILAASLCVYRVARGPTAADRIVAIDIFGILIVGFCAILTVSTERSWYIDIGIAWALQSFIGSLALAKYLEGKGLEE